MLKNFLSVTVAVSALVGVFALSGCGGGGGGGGPTTPTTIPDPREAVLDRITEIQELERTNMSDDDVVEDILRAATRSSQHLRSRSLGSGSTTQSSYRTRTRLSFLPEYDAEGMLQFGLRVLDADGTTRWLRTTNEGASVNGVEDIPAENWKGVELTAESNSYHHYVDLFSDIENSEDTDYLAMGYWIRERKERTDSNYAFAIAAGGSDPFTAENVVGLTGTATYDGYATGLHTKKENAAADPVIDYFTAKASLMAVFGDANALGTVSGTITEGMTAGGERVPDLTLGSAEISSGGHTFSGSTIGNGLAGEWGGQFYSNGANATDHPGSAAGTFGAKTADDLEGLVGAFATYKN